MYQYQDANLSVSQRVDDLLPRLSIREKVGQLNQHLYGFRCYERRGDQFSLTGEAREEIEYFGGLGVLYGLYRADPWSGKTAQDGIPPALAAKAYNMVQREVLSASRWGIPALMSTESPHGHQALGGYLLPVNLAVGATFNPTLAQEGYARSGSQLAQQKVDLALLSLLDISRDPRWGRSEECFGEDPYLASVMTKAAIDGYHSQNVGVIAKHLYAQGETTGGLNASAARVGQKELEEIHFPPVIAACQEKVEGFMAAYNEINGVLCHGNSQLLNETLRGTLGFEGVIMADGVAIDRLDQLTGDTVKSGALALNSGVDISLWDQGFTKLEQAIEKGYATEETLDRAVRRVLTLKFSRGLFESPFMDESKEVKQFSVKEYPESLQIARESVVLLKNKDNLLPLHVEEPRKIAVIGPNANSIYNQIGDYSPPIAESEGTTLWQGLQELTAESAVSLAYETGVNILSTVEQGMERAVALAKESDLIVLAVGGSSNRFGGNITFDTNGAFLESDAQIEMDCGEGMDADQVELPGAQPELILRILELKKPVVAVVIGGRPYAIPQLKEHADAILYSFYPGPAGGRALAELLFGRCSPSGRLPVSLPVNSGRLPCYYNHSKSYTAGNYYQQPKNSLYHFGDGLSYTNFRYADVAFHTTETQQGKQTTATLRVTNVGEYSCSAVFMLYLKYLQSNTIGRIKELCGFEKVKLEPGESKIVTLVFPAMDGSRGSELTPLKMRYWIEEQGKELENASVELLE